MVVVWLGGMTYDLVTYDDPPFITCGGGGEGGERRGRNKLVANIDGGIRQMGETKKSSLLNPF